MEQVKDLLCFHAANLRAIAKIHMTAAKLILLIFQAKSGKKFSKS